VGGRDSAAVPQPALSPGAVAHQLEGLATARSMQHLCRASRLPG
jgi:hypothetical protein